jgi:hypothetical protein
MLFLGGIWIVVIALNTPSENRKTVEESSDLLTVAAVSDRRL